METNSDEVLPESTPASIYENSTPPPNGSAESHFLLHDFHLWYQHIHGYASAFVCITGIIFNAMNIIVLTRPVMKTSTNVILTALAVADMLTMISYLPWAIYFYCVAKPEQEYPHSYGWVTYNLLSTNIVITLHTIAMWLTVSLAVFRYITVCHYTLGLRLCTIPRAKITIVAVVITTMLFLIPNYILYKPEKQPTGYYWYTYRHFVKDFHKVFNYWLYGVVLKVTPCVLLTVLSALLICAMQRAEKKRIRLKKQGNRAASERTSDSNRTTAMLVAVVLCFIITEFPQGVLTFLSGVDDKIFNMIYLPLGDLFDFVVLVNSAVNFLLYCIMSRLFRKTFRQVFLPWIKVQQVGSGTTATRFQTQVNGTYSAVNTNCTTTRL